MADVFSPQPVKTKAAGDVSVKIDQTTPGTTNLVALAANQSVNVAQVNGVATTMGNGVAGTGVQRITIASDSTGQVALAAGSATIGALTANQSVNNAQIAGVATSVGNGVSGTGVQRVTLASDSTGQVALAAGSATIGALTANQSVNVAQMNGVTTAMGSGTTSTGTQRVVLATDQTSIPVTTGVSGTMVDDYSTSAALAAGSTVTLDSTQIASGTGSLVEATVSASVKLKAQLGTWDGTTFTVKRTFFVDSNQPLIYIPQRYDEIQKATGATAKFRWSITNMDNANAADVYCSTSYWR